ncbi:Tetratricopeptide repeat-containing protein [Desulfotomaculum arcticum]|uniref:Tetratricopeptide repeat-containing protein n=1 Tax=Desulfotruncus arcticus DSM 17038 TaxID=1121424 RepID=A0A1I2VGE9_9FIRM|nr:tetratricopeptide repeat protein [Desulfotruncus arcticus]SFG88368.1 Tetratricopeptide repeat-containing protein [Desulfotomaculum arcticum] [Desulfotruncus arcticus DSM 17038]
MANKKTSNPFSFVNIAKRKKQQKIVFVILTIVLGVGLVGSSMFWAFGSRSNMPQNSDTATAQQQQQSEESIDKQITDLEKQVKEKPEDLELLARLAGLYWQNGKGQQAVETYQKALEIKPGDVKLGKDLASTYYLMGQYDHAISQAEQVIKQAPSDAEAHYLLGQFYAYRGDDKRDVQKGLTELEEFIKLQKEGLDVDKAQQMIQSLKAENK